VFVIVSSVSLRLTHVVLCRYAILQPFLEKLCTEKLGLDPMAVDILLDSGESIMRYGN
jgi:hypothetical protein